MTVERKDIVFLLILALKSKIKGEGGKNPAIRGEKIKCVCMLKRG